MGLSPEAIKTYELWAQFIGLFGLAAVWFVARMGNNIKSALEILKNPDKNGLGTSKMEELAGDMKNSLDKNTMAISLLTKFLEMRDRGI